MRDIPSVLSKHRAFWGLNAVKRPLVGYCVDDWNQLQQYSIAKSTLPLGLITPEMLQPRLLFSDYRKILEYNDILEDDLVRSAEPLPAIPWMEAIIGCPIHNSGKNIWAKPLSKPIRDLQQIRYNPNSPWVIKYMEFIDVLATSFGKFYPIAQAILRGPADMLSAAIGEVQFIHALYDKPEEVMRVGQSFAELYNEFMRDQIAQFPEFHAGHVIGQYHIWAPGKCSRSQDDASALFSPDLYKRFFQHLDREVARVTEFSLIHLHTSSLFLLDLFLEIEELKAIEVSLDEGGARCEDVVDSLKKIQNAGKCLVIKGVMDKQSTSLVREKLSIRGICLQAVVSNLDEAKKLQDILASYDEWNCE